MNKKILREWKKVFKSDLSYIVYELKDLVKSPALIILEGPVGAGKTTFCQNFIGEKEVLSPTYSILSEVKKNLHADFYRLEKSEDIIQLELSSYLEDKEYFLVEWGQKFANRLMRELPENYSSYLLEIQIHPGNHEDPQNASRDFFLYSIHED